jgi:hypothetical protein
LSFVKQFNTSFEQKKIDARDGGWVKVTCPKVLELYLMILNFF